MRRASFFPLTARRAGAKPRTKWSLLVSGRFTPCSPKRPLLLFLNTNSFLPCCFASSQQHVCTSSHSIPCLVSVDPFLSFLSFLSFRANQASCRRRGAPEQTRGKTGRRRRRRGALRSPQDRRELWRAGHCRWPLRLYCTAVTGPSTAAWWRTSPHMLQMWRCVCFASPVLFRMTVMSARNSCTSPFTLLVLFTPSPLSSSFSPPSPLVSCSPPPRFPGVGHIAVMCPSPEGAKDLQTDVECHLCRGKGHMQARCPNTVPRNVCWKCGVYGHIGRCVRVSCLPMVVCLPRHPLSSCLPKLMGCLVARCDVTVVVIVIVTVTVIVIVMMCCHNVVV